MLAPFTSAQLAVLCCEALGRTDVTCNHRFDTIAKQLSRYSCNGRPAVTYHPVQIKAFESKVRRTQTITTRTNFISRCACSDPQRWSASRCPRR